MERLPHPVTGAGHSHPFPKELPISFLHAKKVWGRIPESHVDWKWLRERDFKKKVCLLPFQPREGRSWLGPRGQEQAEEMVGSVGTWEPCTVTGAAVSPEKLPPCFLFCFGLAGTFWLPCGPNEHMLSC